jgi:hypothetical protein
VSLGFEPCLNVTEHEKERLLLIIIPQTYIEYWESDEPTGSTLTSLSACFRTVKESASKETNKKVAGRIIKIIKEESQETAYGGPFCQDTKSA